MKHERYSFPLLIILSFLFILASCTQASPSQTAKPATVPPTFPTATPTALPSPIFTTPIPVGAAPKNCPPSQPAQSLSPNLAPVVGKSPVWVTLPALIPLSEGYTQYGWAYKLIWEVGPKFPHTVTLYGTNLRTNASLLFQIGDQAPTASPLLDPLTPGHPVSAFGDVWAEWGSYIFLPGPACYSLGARWPGGRWIGYFAAGN